MKYDIKEYTPVFDIHYKKEYAMMQERVVAEKIMKLLNDNKYDDIERFEQAMPSYSYFLKECNMDNVVMFFGKRFDEEDNIFKIENKKGIISIIDENGEKIYPNEEQKQTQTQYVYKLDMPNTAA